MSADRPAGGLSWPVRAALGAALLVGARAVLEQPLAQRADVRVGDAIRRAGSPALDRAVTLTTDLGSLYGVVGLAAVLAAARRRRTAADVLAVGAVTWNVAQASKRVVRRRRPYEADGVRRLIRPPTGSSFPSGHAAVGAGVMAVVGAAAAGPAGRRAADAVGAYVALSRVYVGVHYPTDVIGGAGMGLTVAAVWRGPLAAGGRRVVGALTRKVSGRRGRASAG